MREPLEEMGRTAAEEALKLIAEPGREYIQRTVACDVLHARRTTVGDQWDTSG